MSSIYQQALIQRAKSPSHSGKLAVPTYQADGVNAACGDEVHVELIVRAGTIVEARHQCRACSVCVAAADLLMEALQGQPLSAVPALLSPTAAGERIGIELSPVRVKCSLLPAETVRLALEQAEV